MDAAGKEQETVKKAVALVLKQAPSKRDAALDAIVTNLRAKQRYTEEALGRIVGAVRTELARGGMEATTLNVTTTAPQQHEPPKMYEPDFDDIRQTLDEEGRRMKVDDTAKVAAESLSAGPPPPKTLQSMLRAGRAPSTTTRVSGVPSAVPSSTKVVPSAAPTAGPSAVPTAGPSATTSKVSTVPKAASRIVSQVASMVSSTASGASVVLGPKPPSAPLSTTNSSASPNTGNSKVASKVGSQVASKVGSKVANKTAGAYSKVSVADSKSAPAAEGMSMIAATPRNSVPVASDDDDDDYSGSSSESSSSESSSESDGSESSDFIESGDDDDEEDDEDTTTVTEEEEDDCELDEPCDFEHDAFKEKGGYKWDDLEQGFIAFQEKSKAERRERLSNISQLALIGGHDDLEMLATRAKYAAPLRQRKMEELQEIDDRYDATREQLHRTPAKTDEFTKLSQKLNALDVRRIALRDAIEQQSAIIREYERASRAAQQQRQASGKGGKKKTTVKATNSSVVSTVIVVKAESQPLTDSPRPTGSAEKRPKLSESYIEDSAVSGFVVPPKY